MVNAVVDTNVIVAGILTSSAASASRSLMDRPRNGDFVLLLSPAALLEIREVLALTTLREIHRLTDEDIRRFCRRLEIDTNSRVLSPTTTGVASPHSRCDGYEVDCPRIGRSSRLSRHE